MSGVRNVREICMGEFIVASRNFSRFVSRQEETLNTFLRQDVVVGGIRAREDALRELLPDKLAESRLKTLQSEARDEEQKGFAARNEYRSWRLKMEETKALLLHLKLKIEEQENRAVSVPAPLLSEYESALSSFLRARAIADTLGKEP